MWFYDAGTASQGYCCEIWTVSSFFFVIYYCEGIHCYLLNIFLAEYDIIVCFPRHEERSSRSALICTNRRLKVSVFRDLVSPIHRCNGRTENYFDIIWKILIKTRNVFQITLLSHLIQSNWNLQIGITK